MLYPSDFLSLVVPNKIFRYQYDTGQMPSILAPLTFMDHIRRFDNKHHENMEKMLQTTSTVFSHLLSESH